MAKVQESGGGEYGGRKEGVGGAGGGGWRGGRARNENGRIEFPICDMRPRAVRARTKGTAAMCRLRDGNVGAARWPRENPQDAGSDIIFQQFYLASTSQV